MGQWPENKVYLIVNGLENAGLAMAQALAHSGGRPRLVVTTPHQLPPRSEWEKWPDRTTVPGRQIAGIRSLEGLGAEVLVVRTEPQRTEDLKAAISQAQAYFGALNGLIYALEAAPDVTGPAMFSDLVSLEPARLESYLAGARQSLAALEEALYLTELRPDFCLFGSSLASVLGGRGYGSYAALYSLLDAYIQEHNRTSEQPWQGLNWNIWQLEDAQALSTSLNPRLIRQVITPAQGSQILSRLLFQPVAAETIVSAEPLDVLLTEAFDKKAPAHPDSLVGEDSLTGSVGWQTRPELATPYLAPRNNYEARVAEIWQQVLGIELVGVEDNFFDLGGHSLLVTQLLNKLHKVFPVALSMRNLFENPTVAGMAGLVEAAHQTTAAQAAKPIREQLKGAFPTDRPRLLENYWRDKIAQALKLTEPELAANGDLSHYDLEALAPEIIWHFQQDFNLKIYLHEVPAYPSIEALARFTETELVRLANLKQVVTTTPVALYDRYEPWAATRAKMQPARCQPAVKNKPMVFLHGSPRSGSTLLRVMLAGHPKLFAPPEMDILWYDSLGDWQRSLSDPNYGHGFGWAGQGLLWTFMQLLGQSQEATRARLVELAEQDMPIHEVYARVQSLASPRLLIDKTPTYSMSLDTLRRSEELFEKPKHIFLVRHPYAMIESFLRIRLDKLFGPNIYPDHSAEVDPYVIGEKVWLTCNHNLSQFLSGIDPARQFLLRYEDLVASPRQKMGELCDFMEVPFDEAVLQPYDDKRERMITGIGDPNILQHDKIDPHLGEVWRKIKLPHHLGEPASRLAARFHYELPAESEPAKTGSEFITLSNGLQVNLADPANLNLLLDRLSELSEEEVNFLLERINS